MSVSLSVEKAMDVKGRKMVVEQPQKTYKEYLRNKYQQLVGTPEWAKLGKKKETGSDDDSDEEVLRVNITDVKSIDAFPRPRCTQGSTRLSNPELNYSSDVPVKIERKSRTIRQFLFSSGISLRSTRS